MGVPAGRVLAVAAAVVLLGVGAGCAPRAKPVAQSRGAAADRPATEISDDSLESLANRAWSLRTQQRYSECVPWARLLQEQYRLRRQLLPEMSLEYAAVLNNAAFEIGIGAPRSSFERHALERESLDACRQALLLADTPRQRSRALTLQAFVQDAWGLPGDAVLAYRSAMAADPTNAEARHYFEDFTKRRRM